MGRQTTGLQKRGQVWYIDKRINGVRVCKSLETSDKAEAERLLLSILVEARDSVDRPRTFREGATRYLNEYKDLPSIADAAYHLKLLDAYIGELPLNKIHTEVLQPFIAERLKTCKTKTVNLSLEYVRRVLNLAARKWRDDDTGKPWVESAPLIQMLKVTDRRKPKPITWQQQRDLLQHLPDHLAKMALFTLNTGCRDEVVCSLKWEWEMSHDSLPYHVFLVPQEKVKGRKAERYLVLNKVAQSIVDAQRNKHPVFVFPYKDHRVDTMNNTGWQNARKRCEDPYLHDLHVHDLRHTVGARLRAAGVGEEDRADILWHTNRSMTAHYSLASLANLMAQLDRMKPEKEMLVTSLRRVA